MDIPSILLKKAINAVKNGAEKKNSKNACPPLPDGKFDYSEAKSDHFTFGFSKKVIMPEEKIPGKKKYYIAGYRINNPAVGVLDNLHAKALWIDDNTKRGGVVCRSFRCRHCSDKKKA